MSIPRGYVANHKIWDQMGRVTPNVEWSESHRPHFESFPAPWLPVQRYDREYEYWITISAGKVVALDRNGLLVPAGLKKAWLQEDLATDTAVVLTYTAIDAEEKVIDLTTGVFVTGAVTYTAKDITDALRAQGLITNSETCIDFISRPIGITSYNYWKAAGPDHFNPATLYQHNFRPQALAAVTCDYAITVPLFPAFSEDEATSGGAIQNTSGNLDSADFGTVGWYGSTAINGYSRYASQVAAGDSVVCLLLGEVDVAENTAETPVTTDTASCLVNQVGSIEAITAAGDWYLDAKMGAIFIYEDGGDAIPSPWVAGTTQVQYYHYGSAGSSANAVSSYMCATGPIEYGDFLTYDADSNLVKATLDIANAGAYDGSEEIYDTDPDYDTATDAVISAQLEAAVSGYNENIVGQVIGVVEHPRDYLDRVKTAFSGGLNSPIYGGNTGISASAAMKAPGSSTGGRTDQLTYSGSANTMLIVNLIGR